MLQKDPLSYAHQFEEKYGSEVNKCPYRMTFHLMPKVGWLNDPNGLCQFHGLYHVCFQYTPQDVHGGGGYWGHATSLDLLHWDLHDPIIYGTQKAERDGVYSGSALVDNDQIYFFYTGTYKEEGAYDYTDDGRISSQMMVTSIDGFHTSDKKILLENKDYPDDMTLHIRDPKVWKDDRYHMILGARKRAYEDGQRKDWGGALIYASDDLSHWSLEKRYFPKKRFGYMWECPDFFTLEGHQVLSYCPQGVPHGTMHFQNTYPSGYHLMEDETHFHEWDYGFDFYAPQTFEDEKGRRLLIGWAGMPDTPAFQNLTVTHHWQHALTLPRELVYEEGLVKQKIIGEWNQLPWQEVSLPGVYNWAHQVVYLTASNIKSPLEIILGTSDNALQIRIDQDLITLAFAAGARCGGGRTRRFAKAQRPITQIALCLDSSIVEIFVNDGEFVMTTRLYLEETERYLSVSHQKDISLKVIED